MVLLHVLRHRPIIAKHSITPWLSDAEATINDVGLPVVELDSGEARDTARCKFFPTAGPKKRAVVAYLLNDLRSD